MLHRQLAALMQMEIVWECLELGAIGALTDEMNASDYVAMNCAQNALILSWHLSTFHIRNFGNRNIINRLLRPLDGASEPARPKGVICTSGIVTYLTSGRFWRAALGTWMV